MIFYRMHLLIFEYPIQSLDSKFERYKKIYSEKSLFHPFLSATQFSPPGITMLSISYVFFPEVIYAYVSIFVSVDFLLLLPLDLTKFDCPFVPLSVCSSIHLSIIQQILLRIYNVTGTDLGAEIKL